MASLICKVCRACRNSPFIEHMVNLTDFHKHIHVSWFSSPSGAEYSNCPSGFNQIDLPQYTSYDMLRQQLLLAINEGGEGFGFS